MDTFKQLESKLTVFEKEQFKNLQKQLAGKKLPAAAQGAVQFVVLVTDDHKENNQLLPVVVAVGINYYQCKNTDGILKTWLQNTIAEQAPEMRCATDRAIAAYRRNKTAWEDSIIQGVGPHAGRGTKDWKSGSYILVATNISPFITQKMWSRHNEADRSEVLKSWDHRQHLDALHKLLGNQANLWIGHGKGYVWPIFQAWRESRGINNWIITYNLSRLGTGWMQRAEKNCKNSYHPLYR